MVSSNISGMENLVEVPLITHDHTQTLHCQRYSIQHDLSITPSSNTITSTSTTAPFYKGNSKEWKNQMKGLACTHVKHHTLIRTAADPEQPRILSIVKMNLNTATATSNTNPVMAEVDLSNLYKHKMMSDIIQTFIFRQTLEVDMNTNMDVNTDMDTFMGMIDETEYIPSIKIVLVDSNGNVFILFLREKTLRPLLRGVLVSTQAIMGAVMGVTDSNDNADTGISVDVEASQVAALDKNRILLAITPRILCLNISSALPTTAASSNNNTNNNTNNNAATISSWSKEACHYNRRKSLSNVLKSARGILAGHGDTAEGEEFRLDGGDNMHMGMPATVALCAFDQLDEDYDDDEDDDDSGSDYDAEENENRGIYGRVVCTLHTDGSVRMWTLGLRHSTYTYPKQMHILCTNLDGAGANNINNWSACASDSILIKGCSYRATSRSYGIHYSIMVGRRRRSSEEGVLRLVALRGDFHSGSGNGVMAERMEWVVPRDVDSLVDLDFAKVTDGRGGWEMEMRVLFTSLSGILEDWGAENAGMDAMGDEGGDAMGDATGGDEGWSLVHAPQPKALIAVYKLQSPDPVQIESSNTLDTFAAQERERLVHECNLMAQNGLGLGSTGGGAIGNNGDVNVDALLNDCTKWYMQRIFRSGSVQTVGQNKATDGAVMRALYSVVPSLCMEDGDQGHVDGDTETGGSGKSIELETMLAMKKWAEFDEMRSGPASTPEIRDDSDDEMMGGEDATEEAGSAERRIQQHHARWKKVLLAISHEEAKLLTPVGGFVRLPRTSTGAGVSGSEVSLVLRAGITSIFILPSKAKTTKMAKIAKNPSSSRDQLDSIMLSALEKIENDEGANNREILAGLEARVWHIVANAKLLYRDDTNAFVALANETIAGIATDEWQGLFSKSLTILNKMSQQEVNAWLTLPIPASLMTGPSQAGGDNGMQIDGRKLNNAPFLIPNAARLSQQYIAACRRVALARYVCIVGIEASGRSLFSAEQEKSALVTYLLAVATNWACTQICSSGSKHGKEAVLSLSKGSPLVAFKSSEERESKRPRTLSLSKESQKSSVLCVNLGKAIEGMSSKLSATSAVSSIVEVSKAFIRAAFVKNKEVFPELAVVADVFPEDAPRISLRLLSPLVAFPSNDFGWKSRHEKAADCLLSEIHILSKFNGITSQRAKELQEHASILLKSGPVVKPDPECVGIFLSALRSLPEHWNSKAAASEYFYESAIAETIQNIFDAAELPGHEDDISALSKMEKMKKLLLPWVIASHEQKRNTVQMIAERIGEVAEDPRIVLRHATSVMLLVSDLVERVNVLERHCEMVHSSKIKGSFAKVLVSAINDVIETVQCHANQADYENLVEYPALWSSIFRNSVQGQCWEDAFESCLSNPVKERRVKNFKRLVLAMVNGGALGTLLDKMIFSIMNGQDSSSDLNLHELAAQTLAEASERAVSGGNFTDSPSNNVDYRGCLYALHAAYGNWRRSCQAMDFLGALTLRCIPSSDNAAEGTLPTSGDDKKTNSEIMDDLVLSAVSSAQLIQLIDNPDQRYIVSGEIAPSSDPMNVGGREDGKDRLSRLYTEKDLLLRAKRLIALQTLEKDELSPENLLDILQASDTAIIDALPRLGYFHHAIAFAHCKKENKEGSKPRGCDVFDDAVGYILCNCLAPIAVTLSSPRPDHEDVESESTSLPRPTMHQLRLLLGDGRLPQSNDSWYAEDIRGTTEKGALCMELLRLYTEAYSNENNSIALDLAEKLLELDDGRAALPGWLTDLIIGKSKSNTSGLFANNGGDPTGLLNLFIRNGLYIEACELVASILVGDTHERQKVATARLPEKGSIDFVPYEAIDKLWNLSEEYLRTSMDSILKKELFDARNGMESALERHFQLMQVSEQGMLSARALEGRVTY